MEVQCNFLSYERSFESFSHPSTAEGGMGLEGQALHFAWWATGLKP